MFAHAQSAMERDGIGMGLGYQERQNDTGYIFGKIKSLQLYTES